MRKLISRYPQPTKIALTVTLLIIGLYFKVFLLFIPFVLVPWRRK